MPPSPVMTRRRILARCKPSRMLKRTLKASSSSSSPLESPLLLTVVAIPNNMPDRRMRMSCPKVLLPFPALKLFVKVYMPAKVNSAQELSAWGADRNIPAGEIM
jgi:hypothetical protein